MGSAQYHDKTVPRLMPGGGAGGATTVDELDQLSALLKKRAELAHARPSTAAALRERRAATPATEI